MQRRRESGQPVKGQRRPKARKAPTAHVSNTDLQEQVAALTCELTEAREQLAEALECQTATGEVLKVISRSPTDVQPVFDMIAESAARLCEGQFCFVYRFDGKLLHFVAHHSLTPEVLEMNRRAFPAPPSRRSAAARAILERGFVQIPDINADPDYVLGAQAVVGNYRSVVGVPILRDGLPIGSIAVARAQTGLLPDGQIELLKTFADQAAIAIENVRLFEAEQQRTRELSESLEQQTATAEVLKVVSSSPGELEPVFNAMLENATRICEAEFGNLFLREGDSFRAVAVHGKSDYADSFRREPVVRMRDYPDAPLFRVFKNKHVVHIPDLRQDESYLAGNRRVVSLVDSAGARTLLNVPMLKENELVGAIGIYRQEVRPFTDKQIELVQNFAAQAVIAIENTRLLSELRESLQQQTATADVLKVISSSPGNLEPVFQAMLEKATQICEGKFGVMFRFADGEFRAVSWLGNTPAYIIEKPHVVSENPHTLLTRLAYTKQPVHSSDVTKERAYIEGNPRLVALVETAGARSLLVVPMVKNEELVGAIVIYWQEARPFTEKQIELLTNFAAQAVIAIENARLLSELRESLHQQTATADVLKVISTSPGELEPVFQAMLKNATRICDANFGIMWGFKDGAFRGLSWLGITPEFADYVQQPRVWGPETGLGQLAHTKQTVHVTDTCADRAYADRDPNRMAAIDVGGVRTFVSVPMLKDGELVGAIGIFRQEVRPFTDKQIELVTNFAAQAVIAIENTRLLNELRQRTDDLTESLEQQTATSEILVVISNSPTDTQPAFDAIVHSGLNLFPDAVVAISLPDRDLVKLAAIGGADETGVEALRGRYPLALSHEFITSTAILDRREIDIADARKPPKELTVGAQNLLAGGYRAMTVMPMMRGDETIGALNVVRRHPGALSDKQRELLRTFANQAVIAIENTRLFNELRESLQQQTATADVLKVISSSPGELEPVFNAMLENAVRICGAKFGNLMLREGDGFLVGATHGAHPAYVEYLRSERVFLHNTGLNQLVNTKEHYHLLDLAAVRTPGDKLREATINLAGARTLIGVPMLKDDKVIGAIIIYRQEVRPFTDKQIELVKNFAAQAVIAIENTRLLSELRESLQQQTATADVLKVISRSTFDLGTVLQTLVESAARLCDADKTNITRQKDGVFFRAEAYGFSPEFMDYVRNIPIQPDRGSTFGRALLERRAVHIPDVKADPEYTLVEGQKLGDYRTTLAVPMLREGVVIGVLSLTRSEVRPFSEKQIELATTFADQAAIAIENVRLFESVEARTRELAASLENLRTTQDRLVQTQKLASLGQLTAGIAHEIKNPLNFVNNFSGVSSELIDELQDALTGLSMDQKTRAEINELTDTLRGNLDKVVQHGKRADAIVKNMLLHSREGSGEHRVVDINTLVEESLNLAYHGARAEKQGFNITMERSLDPDAGQADVFPQDITRVLLNLISNGFYAATKRRAEADGDRYEPTLMASTRSLGNRVEIRVRDNGTGIPPEVKEKMFNPFFTTKPAGEGTGLGLSICHDIIVKQHGGSIEVDTQPGEFTEIRVVLPRAAAVLPERS